MIFPRRFLNLQPAVFAGEVFFLKLHVFVRGGISPRARA
jgi:hypothetical protein